jgi:flavin reductase (DIM6/NTAB) family NADH-FMN oxidoreductase RutF
MTKPVANIQTVEDARQLRHALGRFATGVTVITTRAPDGKPEGLTANSFSSVSLDPPLVLWSLQKKAPSLASFRASGFFAVHVLGAHQHDLCRHFATPAENKFLGVPHETGLGDCPVLPDSIARFECVTHSVVEGGDHWIFIGRVVRAIHGDGAPLIFSAGSFGIPTPFEETGAAPDAPPGPRSSSLHKDCCS